MGLPRRKWLIHIHMKSGRTIRFVCPNFKWQQDHENHLKSITAVGNPHGWDYIQLSEIEAITSRRCWLRWSFRP